MQEIILIRKHRTTRNTDSLVETLASKGYILFNQGSAVGVYLGSAHTAQCDACIDTSCNAEAVVLSRKARQEGGRASLHHLPEGDALLIEGGPVNDIRKELQPGGRW